MFMHGRVVGQFRMESGGQEVAASHKHGLPREFREDFDSRTGPLNDRAANENHFERFTLEIRMAADHVTRDLAAISIS
jgi:hypothetical protein